MRGARHLCRWCVGRSCLGVHRPDLPLLGHVATVINTGTTIVTFLMVFLIQNTQNRDSKAMQLKLDELIRAIGHARNKLVDLENSDDETIDKLHEEFKTMREKLDGPKPPETTPISKT